MSIFRFVLSFVIALSLSVVSAGAAEFKRIKKESEFVNAVVDKKASADWGWTITSSDGTIMGK